MILLNLYQKIFLKISCCLFLIISVTYNSFSQERDIWDDSSTLVYARYLYDKQDYRQSAIEYERYVFQHPMDTSVVSRWVRSYAKAGNDKQALDILRNWYLKVEREPQLTYNIERAWLLLRLKHYDSHARVLDNIEEWRYKSLHRTVSVMLQKEWDKAIHQLENSKVPVEQKLYSIAYEAAHDNYKSPFLAGVMSAIVPGTGKFYVGRYVDGLISLVFVGIMTYQAGRFFKVYGVDSVPAWIYTGLGGLYYSANIFGTVKAAKEYNQTKTQKYVDKTNRIIYSVY